MTKRRFAVSVMVTAIMCGGLMLTGGASKTRPASAADPVTFNAATAENMFGFIQADSVTYAFEDVVDYNGVAGDTGVLCSVIPIAGKTTATGYFYSKLPLDTSNITVNFKVLEPDPLFATETPDSETSNYVDWFAAGFLPSLGSNFYDNAIGAGDRGIIFETKWGLSCRVPANGTLMGHSPWANNTWAVNHGGYGFCDHPLNNVYTAGISHAAAVDEFELTYNKFFDAATYDAWGASHLNVDPYSTDGETAALEIKPSNLPTAYFTFGVQLYLNATPAPAFKVLIKDITAPLHEAKSLDIEGDAARNLQTGSYLNLTHVFTPAATTFQSVTWESSAPGVATVNAKGRVTGVAAGTAVITVKSTVGDFEDSVTVTVKEPVSGVSFASPTASVEKGGTIKLTPVVTPAGADQSVTFVSANDAIATVSADGTVTGVAAGEVVITAISVADTAKTGTVTVTVTAPATPPEEEPGGCKAAAGSGSLIGGLLLAAGAVIMIFKKGVKGC